MCPKIKEKKREKESERYQGAVALLKVASLSVFLPPRIDCHQAHTTRLASRSSLHRHCTTQDIDRGLEPRFLMPALCSTRRRLLAGSLTLLLVLMMLVAPVVTQVRDP